MRRPREGSPIPASPAPLMSTPETWVALLAHANDWQYRQCTRSVQPEIRRIRMRRTACWAHLRARPVRRPKRSQGFPARGGSLPGLRPKTSSGETSRRSNPHDRPVRDHVVDDPGAGGMTGIPDLDSLSRLKRLPAGLGFSIVVLARVRIHARMDPSPNEHPVKHLRQRPRAKAAAYGGGARPPFIQETACACNLTAYHRAAIAWRESHGPNRRTR